MDISLVLECLRGQFKEQMVLYARDLAKILNKSEKAVQQLISRGSLPFQVKTIGGRKCVDIFQVAQWLASDLEAPDELPSFNEKTSSKGSKASRSAAQSGRSSIGVRIMERRHVHATQMMRLADALQNLDERVFLRAVAEKFAFPSNDQNYWGFKVSCNVQNTPGDRTESSVVYADKDQALDALERILTEWRSSDFGRAKISERRNTLFLAMKVCSGRWVPLEDKLRISCYTRFADLLLPPNDDVT